MKNKSKKAVKIIAVVLLTIGSYAAWEISSTIQIEKPTGPYAVGTLNMELTDSLRMEDSLSAQRGYRRLILQFWYPATYTKGVAKAKYHPDPDYFDREVNRMLKVPEFMLARLSKSTTNSWVNAPVSTAESAYPVLIFSHGMNGMRFMNTYQMEELSSHGYIVVSIEHSFTALGTVFHDGSKGGSIPFERLEEDHYANAMVDKWSADQIFVCDYLEKINCDKQSAFFGKLNLDNLGVFGYSFGGAVATNTLTLEKRIKAGVNLDGFYYGGHTEEGFDQAFMEIRSQPASPEEVTDSELAQSHLTRERWKFIWFEEWNKRLKAYTKHEQEPYYSYTVAGADHFSFCDLPLMAPFASLITPKTKRIHQLTNQYTLAFFDQQLKGIESKMLIEHKKLLK